MRILENFRRVYNGMIDIRICWKPSIIYYDRRTSYLKIYDWNAAFFLDSYNFKRVLVRSICTC